MAQKELVALNTQTSRLETMQTGDTASLSGPLSVQGEVAPTGGVRFPDGTVATTATHIQTPTAAQVPNTPAGNIAATNVQDAINELDAEKAASGANTDITSLAGGVKISANGQSSLIVDSADGLGNTRVEFHDVGIIRWAIQRNNANGKLVLQRYDTLGALQDTPISVNDATGEVSVAADPTTPLGVATKQYVDATAGDAALLNALMFG